MLTFERASAALAKRYDWPGLSYVLGCLSTMLDDRPYMRPEEPRFRGPSIQQPWSGWAILLTINVVVFLLQVLIDPSSLATHMATFEKSFVGQWLALDSSQISWLLPMQLFTCLLYTSPSPRDATLSRMPSSA